MVKHFNLKRFFNYLKYDLQINGKTYLYFCVGLFIALFFVEFYTIVTTYNLNGFRISDYAGVFIILYIISGVLVIGTSFPALRKTKGTVNFLTLPVSALEKYFAQFLIRIIGFTVIFFVLFWLSFKLSYAFYNLFEWKHHVNIVSFGLFAPFDYVDSGLDLFAVICGIFSIASFLFLGATYFKKYAVFKTIFLFSLLLGIVLLFMVLLSHLFLPDLTKGFEIKLLGRNINESLYNIQLFFYVIGIASSLFLLPLAYLKLKEKEV